MRKQFDDNRELEAGGDKTAAAIEHAEAVAKVLRENVVQGEATEESGRFSRRYIMLSLVVLVSLM